ncbi:cell death-inducing p53-target protein 1 homolog isoform X2 [Dysidea avara]|uniref:cell death-inducing p53-target protein 1 homolog isoform X2 n=1 Tax=Dysidea avara TaxID=196820 RepID=UPI0033346E53
MVKYAIMSDAPPPYDAGKGYPPAQQPPHPPAQGCAPVSPQTTTASTVVVTQQQPVTAVVPTTFGEAPMTCNCHICNTQQVTRVTYTPGTLTWLVVLILCLFGLWPCALIPLYIDGLQDAVHTCPNCNSQVGVHRRM